MTRRLWARSIARGAHIVVSGLLGGARRSTIVVSAATAPAPNRRSLEESHRADRGRPPTMLPTGVRPEIRANLAAMNLWQGLHVVGVNRAAMTVLRP